MAVLCFSGDNMHERTAKLAEQINTTISSSVQHCFSRFSKESNSSSNGFSTLPSSSISSSKSKTKVVMDNLTFKLNRQQKKRLNQTGLAVSFT